MLLFIEQINCSKNYPRKKEAVHHYNFLKIKLKFGTVIDFSVRIAQGIIYSFPFAPQSTRDKIAPLLNPNGVSVIL